MAVGSQLGDLPKDPVNLTSKGRELVREDRQDKSLA